ncbi:4Fe-4S binding protein [bacterium]|nr:4Fe-4S binding protein [bacterium]
MFKLVCGAGNEDAESVKRLVYVYSSAGCKLFDLSARKEILAAAKEGVSISKATGVKYCVSVGIKGDRHISKAVIEYDKCTNCAVCNNICPNDALNFEEKPVINSAKCIGCKKCFYACPSRAIRMDEKDVDISEVLPYMVNNGVEFLELHIMGHDKADLEKKWKIINDCNPKFASICIDRENFGNAECLERIREMISVRDPFTTIVQADGIPMSGADDTFKTTLQAVAMAEIIQNANLPVYIMLSGGTNSKTAILAKQCGINYWGIAIGSWARKIVKEYVNLPDFWENKNAQIMAINKAKNLIITCV